MARQRIKLDFVFDGPDLSLIDVNKFIEGGAFAVLGDKAEGAMIEGGAKLSWTNLEFTRGGRKKAAE
jgi:hypothetical protein